MESTCPWCLPHRHQVLRGPADAASALYEMLGQPDAELIAVLILDAEHRVITATAVDGAVIAEAPLVLDLYLETLSDGPRSVVVLAIMRPPGATAIRPDELILLEQLWRQCDGGNVDLLDVLIVSGREWRSVAELAGLGPRES